MKKLLSFLLSLILILVCAAFIAKQALEEEMEIYEKTLRLHIPANSDSAEDQAVKLLVRDAIIEYLREPLATCQNRDEAIAKVQSLTTQITLKANEVLKSNNKSYSAKVSVVNEYYPEKAYDGLTLPAGEYASLKIELGEADGQNWWCVLFPQVCVGTAKPEETLAQVGFTPNQIRVLTDHEDYQYVVKFKLLEVIESIFG